MTDEEFAEAYAEKNYGTHPKMADLIACSKLAVLAGIEYAKKQFAKDPCTSYLITDSLEQSLDDCN